MDIAKEGDTDPAYWSHCGHGHVAGLTHNWTHVGLKTDSSTDQNYQRRRSAAMVVGAP